MADKQAQAMERLLTKLSAIRKTLRGEERKLLDAMVLGAQAEVTAHASTSAPISKKASEVEMHSLKERSANASTKDQKASERVAQRAARSSAAEVDMHSFNVRRSAADQRSSSAASEQSSVAGAEAMRILHVALEDGNHTVAD